MSFIDWVERHRRSLIFVAAALTLAGIYAGITLPIGLFPVVTFPRIRVEIDSGNMPSRQMLVEVTEPLEEVARAVPGAVNVESTTTRGSAEMFIDFPWGSDMKSALQAVNGAFAQKLPDLPQGVGYEILQMRPTALMPFVSYALISDKVASSDLRQIAKYQITPLLDSIQGISRVGVLGGQHPEVQVYVSPEKLRAYGLSMSDVESAISDTNTLDAVGQFQDNYLLYLTIASGAFDSVNSVKNVTIHTGQHGIVALGDIATVKMGSKPQWLLINDNGKPAVTFDVYQQDTADSISLAKQVQAKLDEFMKAQPSTIHLYKWYDQTELVHSSIDAMEEAILIGLVFAFCVILGFLRNWRAAAVAMIVVPMSVMVTCLLLSVLGMTFNIMTLGGIAAAIGLLIDDVIVMIEQIARRCGVPNLPDPQRAVITSAKEFLAPLTGSSLATIIMFIPLAFLDGVTGAFFKFLSVTMASSLIISYILTALVVPLLSHGIVDFQKWHDPSHGRETPTKRFHGRTMNALFRRPWWIAVGIVIFVGLGYVGYRHVGTGFLPKMDEGGFVLDYQTTPGTSLIETNRQLEQIEAILKKNPYVYTYSRRTGAGLGGDLNLAFQGDFFVRLVPASKRPNIWKVMDSLTDEINTKVPGLNSFDTHQLLGDMVGDMVGRPSPVVVNLSAKDPKVLMKLADKVANAISKVPGVDASSVDNGLDSTGVALILNVDPGEAAMHGVTAAEVKDQVHRYLHGSEVTNYLGPVEGIGVRVWAHGPLGKVYRSDLDNLPIHGANGQVFPLNAVANFSFVGADPQLVRDNLGQIVPVTADIKGSLDLGTVIAGVKKALQKPGLIPAGVTYELGGAYHQQQLAVHGMVKVFVAAVIAEFILLLFLYETFSIPIIIIISSLISTGAVFLGLWISGVELNITGMMGMVMIIGISTEMSVFLFSEFQMLEKTMPPRQAIFEAAINRFRPIAMSTLAMILALLPLGVAISGSGDQMLQPLAIAIIAGSLVQLPLVLLAMPVVVGLLHRQRERAPAMGVLQQAGGRRTRPGAAE